MKPTRRTRVEGVLLISAALLLTLGASLSWAAGPEWKWAMSIRGTEKAAVTLKQPTSLFIDEQKARYYVMDCLGNRVVAYDKEGKPLTSFTDQGKLKTPYDMTRLADGRLVIVEKGKGGLSIYDLKAKSNKHIPLSYKGRKIVVDRIEYVGGSLYVLDKAWGGIFRLDKGFKPTRHFAPPRGSSGFSDFAIKRGRVWALGVLEKRIYVFDDTAKVMKEFDLGRSVGFPVSVALGKSGSIYVLDRHRGQVMVYDTTGKKKKQFLAKGNGRGKLYYPSEILFDPWGRLCVVDEGNGRVEVFEQ